MLKPRAWSIVRFSAAPSPVVIGGELQFGFDLLGRLAVVAVVVVGDAGMALLLHPAIIVTGLGFGDARETGIGNARETAPIV